jgi:DNA-binding response OmpR family regulator
MDSRGRLLLVEDEVTLVRLLERALRQAGYEVATCTTGGEALAKQSEHFSAAIIDLTLPDMNGATLVPTFSACPVIVSSGTPVSADRFGGAAARVRVLQKPYMPKDLLALLDEVVKA